MCYTPLCRSVGQTLCGLTALVTARDWGCRTSGFISFQARAGLLKYDVALEVFFAILKTEENYYVWFAAFDTAKYVKKRLGDQKGQFSLSVSQANRVMGSSKFFNKNE